MMKQKELKPKKAKVDPMLAALEKARCISRDYGDPKKGIGTENIFWALRKCLEFIDARAGKPVAWMITNFENETEIWPDEEGAWINCGGDSSPSPLYTCPSLKMVGLTKIERKEVERQVGEKIDDCVFERIERALEFKNI